MSLATDKWDETITLLRKTRKHLIMADVTAEASENAAREARELLEDVSESIGSYDWEDL